VDGCDTAPWPFPGHVAQVSESPSLPEAQAPKGSVKWQDLGPPDIPRPQHLYLHLGAPFTRKFTTGWSISWKYRSLEAGKPKILDRYVYIDYIDGSCWCFEVPPVLPIVSSNLRVSCRHRLSETPHKPQPGPAAKIAGKAAPADSYGMLWKPTNLNRWFIYKQRIFDSHVMLVYWKVEILENRYFRVESVTNFGFRVRFLQGN